MAPWQVLEVRTLKKTKGYRPFLSGRINRAAYWTGIGILVAGFSTAAMLGWDPPGGSEVFLIVLAVLRLHDIGLSGWWALAPITVEIAGMTFVLSVYPLQEATQIFGWIVLIHAGFIVWLGTVGGQPDANRYGEPPARGLAFNLRRQPRDK